MPDNVLRIATEVDLAGLTGFTAGADEAAAASLRLAAATVANARAQQQVSAITIQARDAVIGEAAYVAALADAQKIAAATAAELAAAQAALKVSSEVASSGMGSLERATAMAGGRFLGMEAGMGMAGGAIGRIAAQLPGLGTAFAIAFPLALIDFAVEKIEAFRLAIEKANREVAEFAIDSDKAAESIQLENLKLEDQIQKFEHRPAQNMLKEAILETKIEAEALSKSFSEAAQKAIELLNVGSLSMLFSKASGDEKAALENLQPILNQITAARLKLEEAPPGSAAQADATKDQIDLYKKLNDQIDIEISKMKGVAQQVTLAEGGQGAPEQVITLLPADTSDSIAKLQNLKIGFENAAKALTEFHKEAALKVEVAGLEQEAADPRKKAFDQWQDEQNRAIIRSQEAWKKYYADQINEEAKAKEERARIAADGSKEMSDALAVAGKTITDIDIENAKADAAGVERVLEEMRIAREKVQAGGGGFFPNMREDNAELQTLNTEMSAVAVTIQRLQADIKRLNDQPFLSETDEKDIQKYNQELSQQESILNKLKVEYQSTATKIEQMWKQVSKTIAQDFTGAVNQILLGHEKIGQAALRLAQQLELYIIDQGIKMVVTHYGTELLQMLAAHSSFLANLLGITTAGNATQIAAAKATQTGIVTAEAGEAAAAGFASVMVALPFPINVATAPGVAAQAGAEALSVGAAFEFGGIIPGVHGQAVPIVGHAGEAVLPTSLTTLLTNAATNNTSSSSHTTRFNQENHFHKTGDMSEANIARLVKRAAKRGMLSAR